MTSGERDSAKRLALPPARLAGVGPQRAELLARLGLRTAADLAFFFPRDYFDQTLLRDVDELVEGTVQSVRGVIEDVDIRVSSTGKCVVGVLLKTERGFLRGLWFNQPFMRDRYPLGLRVMFSGKPRRDGLFWEMAHPRVTALGEKEEAAPAGLLPIYPLTEGLRQHEVRRAVRAALRWCVPLLEEAFPADFRAARNLMPLAEALPAIHFPRSGTERDGALRRFVYQELFVLQLALAVRRHRLKTAQAAPAMPATEKIDARIRSLFPFDLTDGQKKAIAEIAADMAATEPMNRLLQGDVGSGKTVVAAYAMLLAIAHGHQAVLMAPTEILARQHADTLERMLAHSRVRRGQLVGGMAAGERNKLLAAVAAGEVDLLVGTHALVQDDVRFHRLGLVVIDEQHKFGVRQRALLRQAGHAPHYLVMTATPIPRTVTMALFGDLDLSALRDMPPGRRRIHTYLVPEDRRERWWEFFRKGLREGRQGYVVAPLVEESEQLDVASIQAAYEHLANGELEAFRLGLVHGRMTAAEKDAVMARFRSGEVQVLVSTSVVEVGVDVPNATLMTILSGERFGLAQLHQLRGRIGRGGQPGYCGVFAESSTAAAEERLKTFEKSADGFELAETDFRLRGPGEVVGTRQHGLPPLRVADLVRDRAVLQEARGDALELVAADPGLAQPQHAALRRQMLSRYGTSLELGDVG